ncbi:MAG: SRPBCC family protein [Proteobacteria bacterium]|nr:SRPBCC family protein [Pseudomonadota bacterium]
MPRVADRLLALCSLGLLALPCGGQAAEPAVRDQDVHVERAYGGFVVDVVMHTPVRPAQAWAVLTDFEHMASFVSNLKSSRVLERSEGVLKVHQQGVARYGLFSANFESLREIRLMPYREIHAHGLGGNLQRMESLMRLEPEDGGTRLNYHAEALPGFWFPPMIGPALVRHETAEQFSAMLDEMRRRQERE